MRILLFCLSAGAAAAAEKAPAEPNLAAGQRVFAACAACHNPGGTNRVGPGLGGVVGRSAGTFPGFRFSGAMRRSHLVWTAATLDAYLKDPQGLIPGNTMPFPGIADARQRADLVAYLATLK